jgi:hypothetical protein
VYTFNRSIDPGPHSLAVNIDGHVSHTLDLEV